MAKIHNPTYRRPSPTIYSFDQDKDPSFDSIHGIVADTYKESKFFPVKFRMGLNIAFVPKDTWAKIKGWMRLPKEIKGIEGKIWKEIKKESVVYNPLDNEVLVFIDSDLISKYILDKDKQHNITVKVVKNSSDSEE